jgi:hypothetical protein
MAQKANGTYFGGPKYRSFSPKVFLLIWGQPLRRFIPCYCRKTQISEDKTPVPPAPKEWNKAAIIDP